MTSRVASNGGTPLAFAPGLLRFPVRHHQPPRGFAQFHPPCAFPVVSLDVAAESSSRSQVTFHPCVPLGEAARVGNSRPQVIDASVEAVFEAHDASPADRSKAAQDAAIPGSTARHLVLLRSFYCQRLLHASEDEPPARKSSVQPKTQQGDLQPAFRES